MKFQTLKRGSPKAKDGQRTYNPELGRWISRDPIGVVNTDLNESLSLDKDTDLESLLADDEKQTYLYALNDPTDLLDHLGLYSIREAFDAYERTRRCRSFSGARQDDCLKSLWKRAGDTAKFLIWYNLETARRGWWLQLPKCPPRICFVDVGMYRGGLHPDPGERNKWLCAQRPGRREANLHAIDRLTHWSMRSHMFGGHSNQCIYDDQGKLVRDYPHAGTVDYRSGQLGVGDLGQHWLNDVDPIYLANKIDDGAAKWNRVRNYPLVISPPGPHMQKYYEVRPLHAE